jgi:phosphoserine phosphatase RsbU/P
MPINESPATELASLRQTNASLAEQIISQTRELSKTNQELRLAEEDLRLAAVAFETRDSMMITDREGKILRVNSGFTRLTGYSPADVIGKTPQILRSGRHSRAFYRQMWTAIGNEGYWSGEVWNKRKDGQVYPQRLTITAVPNQVGHITHYVGDGHDLTDERRAEADRLSIAAARKVQEDLLPPHGLNASCYDIAGAVYPADRVSGDYFDFLPLGRDSVGLLVADVCGHGLGPALLMAQMQAYLRALAESHDDPGELLTHANRLLMRSHFGHFVTVFLGRLDRESNIFVYAGAGHRGYLVSAQCQVRELASTSLPLGVDDSCVVPSAPAIVWETGDIIVVPTDGFEETENAQGDRYGCARTLASVVACRTQSASGIVAAMRRAACDFAECEQQQDDMTVVVAKMGSIASASNR